MTKRPPPTTGAATPDDVVQARKNAEAAVAGMLDPDLKREAFSVAFKHFLAVPAPKRATKTRRAGKATAKGKRSGGDGTIKLVEGLISADFFKEQKAAAVV